MIAILLGRHGHNLVGVCATKATHLLRTALSNCDVECIGRAKNIKKHFHFTWQERELETPEVEGHHRRIQEEINV